MPTTANAGLMASASYNPQLTDATFNNVNVIPTAFAGSNYYLRLGADGSTEQIWVGSTSATGNPTYSVLEPELSTLSFIAGQNDSVTIDFSNGNPVPSAGATINGSNTSLIVSATTSADTAVISASSFVFDNSAPITFTNTQSITLNTGNGNDTITQIAEPSATVTFNGGAGNDTLNISGGSYSFSADASLTTSNLTVNVANTGSFVTFDSTEHLAALNLSADGKAIVIDKAPHDVLVTNTLSIANAILDLTDNSLIVNNGDLSALSAQVEAGYNFGNWNSTSGIVSSAAAADTSHLTAVGVLLNDDGAGHPLYGSGGVLGLFSGQNPATYAVLIKYTYYGDANLDGKVDGTDYSRIDNGYLDHPTGWSNGDFNYDNVINGSDYTLIDNAFNAQGASLADRIGLANVASITSQPPTPRRLRSIAKHLNSTTRISLPENQVSTSGSLTDYWKRHPFDLLNSTLDLL